MNEFTPDILIQTPDLEAAAEFYQQHVGLKVTGRRPGLISLEGPQLNLFLEQGEPLGPVLELVVDNVATTRASLVAEGATLLKDEPAFPRCYVQDRYGLIYNLRKDDT